MKTVRVLGHHLSVPLLLLSMIEAGAVALAIYGGMARETPALSTPAFAGVLLVTMMSALGLYQVHLRTTMVGILARTALAFGAAIPLVGLVYLLSPAAINSMDLLLSGTAAFAVVSVIHLAFFACADAGLLRRRILVVGGGDALKMILSLRRRADRRGFEVVGFVAVKDETKCIPGGVPVFEHASPLDAAKTERADEIVVAVDERRAHLPMDELLSCRYAGFQVSEVGEFVERQAGKLGLLTLRPSRLVFDGGANSRSGLVAKRVVDVLASLFILAFSWPLMLAAVIAIKQEDGWRAPVIFKQRRVGAGGKTFELYKFRSMQVDAEADGRPRYASPGDARITRVGRIIRKMRIDELPQLFNVLVGSMSIVGPRPERPEFVEKLEHSIPFYRERHRVKPGITGWAQILYPYGSSLNDSREKLQYDLYYVKNRSLLLDVIILLQTVEVVLFGRGAR